MQVTNNPAMAADIRNQAIIGMSEGIPLFRDKKSRSVTPIALRSAILPDNLSIKFRHIHLAALYPNEFWRLSEERKAFERVPKKPSTITPLLVVLTDELLFWQDGVNITDHSKAIGDPARDFTMRAILLFWCGDYPGLGEASGFAHAGTWPCHWCKIKGEWQFGVGREAYGEYVRYIPFHVNIFCHVSLTCILIFLCTLFPVIVYLNCILIFFCTLICILFKHKRNYCVQVAATEPSVS
jgi:hypothetical protein